MWYRIAVAGTACALIATGAYAAAPQNVQDYTQIAGTGVLTAESGTGILVAVIDSGIAVDDEGFTHPCFAGAKDSPDEKGQSRYTNSKVVVARGYTATGSKSPVPTITHGSHVASIIGCNANTPVWAGLPGHQNRFGSMSGVAPAVRLGNYNVIDENGNGDERAIARAIDDAVADGAKIINMSLGWWDFGFVGPVESAIKRANDAGVLVVAAAGNEGPDFLTVDAPGAGAEVIAVGAVRTPVTVVSRLVVNGKVFSTPIGELGAVAGTIKARAVSATDRQRTRDSFGLGCKKSAIPAAAKGKILIVQRGVCTFTQKWNVAASRGVAAIVMVDPTLDELDYALGADGRTAPLPGLALPAAAEAPLVRAVRNKQLITLSGMARIVRPGNVVPSFTSVGPAFSIIKPDVAAPGDGVIGAVDSTACGARGCFDFYSGTSMASPMVAGMAAALWTNHPDWSMQMVRSAIVHTASDAGLKLWDGKDAAWDRIGNGIIQVAAANDAAVGFSRLSLAFGTLRTETSFDLINPADEAVTVQLSVDSELLEVDTEPIVVPARDSNGEGRYQVSVRLTGDASGRLEADHLTAAVTRADGSSTVQRMLVGVIDMLKVMEMMQSRAKYRSQTNRPHISKR